MQITLRLGDAGFCTKVKFRLKGFHSLAHSGAPVSLYLSFNVKSSIYHGARELAELMMYKLIFPKQRMRSTGKFLQYTITESPILRLTRRLSSMDILEGSQDYRRTYYSFGSTARTLAIEFKLSPMVKMNMDLRNTI